MELKAIALKLLIFKEINHGYFLPQNVQIKGEVYSVVWRRVCKLEVTYPQPGGNVSLS